MNVEKFKIRSIKVRCVFAPLVLPDMETDGGITGRAYLFATGRHNLASIAQLVRAIGDYRSNTRSQSTLTPGNALTASMPFISWMAARPNTRFSNT